jgi:hypothetical protein
MELVAELEILVGGGRGERRGGERFAAGVRRERELSSAHSGRDASCAGKVEKWRV